MTGKELYKVRRKRKRTQVKAARALGVSQAYLSLLENGKRPLTAELRKKAVRVFGLPPTEVPVRKDLLNPPLVADDRLAVELATLGYKGFSYLKPAQPQNPAVVLLAALNANDREARLVEALPWVVLQYPNMEWDTLVKAAKANDLQNRLGFVTNVARRVAEFKGDTKTAAKLKRQEAELEKSLLVREGTLCNESMTNAERRWLETQRPEAARHWRLLTNLSPHHLNYYVE